MELKNRIFTYNHDKRRKILSYVIWFFIILFLVLWLYYFGLKNPVFLAMFNHVKMHLKDMTLLGMFYVTLFGGLFFVTVPIEPLFLIALSKHNPFLVLMVTLAGAVISYSLDYILGLKFSKLSKKLISVKQFYKLKTVINRKGKYAILLFNLIGFGSQQTTFILGVFRYNKTRIFVYSFIGQIIKYVVLMLFAFLF